MIRYLTKIPDVTILRKKKRQERMPIDDSNRSLLLESQSTWESEIAEQRSWIQHHLIFEEPSESTTDDNKNAALVSQALKVDFFTPMAAPTKEERSPINTTAVPLEAAAATTAVAAIAAREPEIAHQEWPYEQHDKMFEKGPTSIAQDNLNSAFIDESPEIDLFESVAPTEKEWLPIDTAAVPLEAAAAVSGEEKDTWPPSEASWDAFSVTAAAPNNLATRRRRTRAVANNNEETAGIRRHSPRHRRKRYHYKRKSKRHLTFAGPDVTCHVCLEEGGETTIPLHSKVTSRCPRDRTICESCLDRHIQACVANQNFDEIQCICCASGNGDNLAACNAILSFRHVKRYASTETFQRYDEGTMNRELEANPDFVWCARPGCGSGQLHFDRELRPRVECHVCRFGTCFTHRCAWHEGWSCEAYTSEVLSGASEAAQARNEANDNALLQLIHHNDLFRTCPKCRQGVEKNGGCAHMTCRCRHEFCWHCLASYQGPQGIHAVGSSGHEMTCVNYSISYQDM